MTFPQPAVLLSQQAWSHLTQFRHELDGLLRGCKQAEQISVLSEILRQAIIGIDKQSDGDKQSPHSIYDEMIVECVERLKPLLGGRGQGNLALGQMNPTPGDISGNARQIIRLIQLAEALEVDAVIFPELALMGYPVEDAILKHPHMVRENMDWLTAIAAETGKTKALVGFVEPRPGIDTSSGQPRIGKPYYNSLAILSEGKIEGFVRKALLPNYAEFNDSRTFEPSNQLGVLPASMLGRDTQNLLQTERPAPLEIAGISYGLSICEDIWNNAQFLSHPLYHQDPIEKIVRQPVNVLLNVSASPSRADKEQMKHNLLWHVARQYKLPLVYVNQVGSVDGLSFDGASRLYDATGELLARSPSFQTAFTLINPHADWNQVSPLPAGLEQAPSLSENNPYVSDHSHDLARTYHSIVQGISDYFAKSGFEKAVLGLSGGLDSSVCAVLLVDALGAENILGVSMPSGLTPQENRSDARILSENLGMHFLELSIQSQIEASEQFAADLSALLKEQSSQTQAEFAQSADQSTGKDNVQAMTRALNLRRLGNDYNALPIATSDKSELYMGYATMNGDMTGAIAPIGDVLKTKVRALAHWLNANAIRKNTIPLRVIEKPSGADLKINPTTGVLVSAEEDLMPYPFLDEAIWRLEYTHADFQNLLQTPFECENALKAAGKPLSAEDKRAWLERFYRLMNRAVFKWYVTPPVILVDGYGISRAEYRRATVSRVNPVLLSPPQIKTWLENAKLAL